MIEYFHPSFWKLGFGKDDATRTQGKIEIVRMGRGALPALHAMLKSDYFYTQVLALELVGGIRDPESIPLIRECAHSRDENVRNAAYKALKEYDSPALAPVVQQLGHEIELISRQRGFYADRVFQLAPTRWVADAVLIGPWRWFDFYRFHRNNLRCHVQGRADVVVSVLQADEDEAAVTWKARAAAAEPGEARWTDQSKFAQNRTCIVIEGDGWDGQDQGSGLVLTERPWQIHRSEFLAKTCFGLLTDLPDVKGFRAYCDGTDQRRGASDLKHLGPPVDPAETFGGQFWAEASSMSPVAAGSIFVFNNSTEDDAVQGVVKIIRVLPDQQCVAEAVYWGRRGRLKSGDSLYRALTWHEYVNAYRVQHEITRSESTKLFEIIDSA